MRHWRQAHSPQHDGENDSIITPSFQHFKTSFVHAKLEFPSQSNPAALRLCQGLQEVLKNFCLKLIWSHGPPGFCHSSSKKIHELCHGVKGTAVLTRLYSQGGQTTIDNTHQEGTKQGPGKESACIFTGWHLGEDMNSFEIRARSCWRQLVSLNLFCSELPWWNVGGIACRSPQSKLGKVSFGAQVSTFLLNSSGGAS